MLVLGQWEASLWLACFVFISAQQQRWKWLCTVHDFTQLYVNRLPCMFVYHGHLHASRCLQPLTIIQSQTRRCVCLHFLNAGVFDMNQEPCCEFNVLTSVSKHTVYIWCVPSSLGQPFDFITSISLLIVNPNSQSECTFLLTTHHVPLGLALDAVMVVGLSQGCQT